MNIKETAVIDKLSLIKVKPSPRDFIFLRGESCDGCGNCVLICPMDLWRMRKGRASLAAKYRERCLECGSCYLACERGAIEFGYPPAGSGVTYERA